MYILIVNAARIPPGPGHALVVRCQRLAAVCEQAGRSQHKQVKACRQTKESRGRQAEAGRRRGGNEKKRAPRSVDTLGDWLKNQVATNSNKWAPRSADTLGDWLKNKLQKQQKMSTQTGRYYRGLAQKPSGNKWQQMGTQIGRYYRGLVQKTIAKTAKNEHPDRWISVVIC